LNNALHIAYNKTSQDAGGMIISQRSSAVEQAYRYGFNNGSERDDEIVGLTGAHFTTKYREGDTQLLRWWSVDPKANMQPWQSPYSYMDGNPVGLNDPDGDCPTCFAVFKGMYYAYKAKYSKLFGSVTKPVIRVASGDSGNVPDHVNMSEQNRAINNFTGTVGDVKEVGEAMSNMAYEAKIDVGSTLDEAGEVTSDVGLLLAIPTEGASLVMVPFGEGMSAAGKTMKIEAHMSKGDIGAAKEEAVMLGVGLMTKYGSGQLIKKSRQVGNIVTKKEQDIQEAAVNMIGSGVNKATEVILDKESE